MYPRPRLVKNHKSNPKVQWALTDRVFFACGACQVLAYAFLEKHQIPDAQAVWIKPVEGYRGNHIFIDLGDRVFDYHGFSDRQKFLDHTFKRARHYHGTGWDAELIKLPQDVLISEAKSKTYDGLWLREPKQFLHDALPRAYKFLDNQ